MSTRGHISVVADDHHYSLYQHHDMYPAGWPRDLFTEAAEITRSDEWDEVAHGWISKAWLDWPDNDLPQRLQDTVVHPDGETAGRDLVHSMRPRASYDELVAEGREHIAKATFRSRVSSPIEGKPSLRAAAEMPAMMKDLTLEDDGHDREFGVVVDLDHHEIVMLAYDWTGRGRRPVPIARADLDDAETMIEIAEWASKASRAPHRSAAHTGRDWTKAYSELKDGQWLRPKGFPPLPGTPNHFPAKGSAFSPPSVAPSDGGPIQRPRCRHVGVRSKKQCMRPEHSDDRHQYPQD